MTILALIHALLGRQSMIRKQMNAKCVVLNVTHAQDLLTTAHLVVRTKTLKILLENA